MRILVINQFADNKGDQAVLHVLVGLIRESCPNARITVSTSRPAAWETADSESHGRDSTLQFVPWSAPRALPFFPRRVTSALFRRWVYPCAASAILDGSHFPAAATAFLNPAFLAALDEADLVISTGGHHFTNWFAKTGISVLFLDLALAILRNKPTCLWSQTLGPLSFSNERNQRFLVRTLESCRRIFVRDKASREAVASVGMSPDNLRDTTESVFALEVSDPQPPSARPARVGISIYTGPTRAAVDFRDYIRTMAEHTQFVVASGCEVLFFPMQVRDQPGDDRPMIRQIVEAAGVAGAARILDEDLPTAEHAREVAQCRIFLAHKTHAVVFALCTGTPTIAIAYHPKTAHFMSLYGQAAQCIAERHLAASWLRQCHEECMLRADELHAGQLETTRRLRTEIRSNFREIFADLPS